MLEAVAVAGTEILQRYYHHFLYNKPCVISSHWSKSLFFAVLAPKSHINPRKIAPFPVQPAFCWKFIQSVSEFSRLSAMKSFSQVCRRSIRKSCKEEAGWFQNQWRRVITSFTQWNTAPSESSRLALSFGCSCSCLRGCHCQSWRLTLRCCSRMDLPSKSVWFF